MCMRSPSATHVVSTQTVVFESLRTLATRGALRLLLRLRETANILADLPRGIHQRGEWLEIGGARMQAQQVEAKSLQCGDALRESRGRRVLPCREHIGVCGTR